MSLSHMPDVPHLVPQPGYQIRHVAYFNVRFRLMNKAKSLEARLKSIKSPSELAPKNSEEHRGILLALDKEIEEIHRRGRRFIEYLKTRNEAAMLLPSDWSLANLPSLLLQGHAQLPDLAAVYFICDGQDVLYIGTTKHLVVRFRNHHIFQQALETSLQAMIAWQPCNHLTHSYRLHLEKLAIARWQPPLNKVRRKIHHAPIEA